ncbi:hypothetical protein PQX77_001870 [Marasmius sp. AFHP31]|nr:hypothetical protein PQX77_001870 [Marasmius sp. AFHP31]
MPLLGSVIPSQPDPPYFKTLEELDEWFETPHRDYDSVLPYRPRSSSSSPSTSTQGKLLVCHDYKGGYTESPHSMGYTFNFWSICDIFVYFSHHRVTIPPPGWITAAHRQGVKILGTLIFEGNAEEDCLRLLVGKLPSSNPSSNSSSTSSKTKKTHSHSQPKTPTLPLTPHYARLLAELAKQRGFDGYLLNFECPLRGGVEQTRALAAWITLLRGELGRRVGGWVEVSWYDSVVFTGQLAWQDRLNSWNLPFFLAADSIFTNYTWYNHYPSLTAQYFSTLDPSLIKSNSDSSSSKSKTLQDIYVGVDIWGRGSHGNGGFGSYKALSHISPRTLGLSVAIFGQAWSWESEQDKPGFKWETWWEYDRKLWTGTRDEEEEKTVGGYIPECPMKRGERECAGVEGVHGEGFVPVKAFFESQVGEVGEGGAFHTTFCPGVGRKWFVDGEPVFSSSSGAGGWTDVDKQTSVGDLVWPKPCVEWEVGRIPSVRPKIEMGDAWNGGSCLRLDITDDDTDAEGEQEVFRCVRVPVQTVRVVGGRTYEAVAVYKLDTDTGIDGFDVDVSLSIKGISSSSSAEEVQITTTPTAENDTQLERGWVKLAVRFTLEAPETETETATQRDISIGLTLAIVSISEEPQALVLNLPILLGQISVFPSTSSPASIPMILWADFTPTPSDSGGGTLSFETATSLPTSPQPRITSPEDGVPAWPTQPTDGGWFPRLLYANVYAQPQPEKEEGGKKVWIGTTKWGGGGRGDVFDVVWGNLPWKVEGKKVRFWVQGVLESGEVMGWERCAYVDVDV